MTGKRDTPLNRFMAKVSMPSDPSDCWTWTASLKSGGYGQILYADRPRPAPRVSMALFRGFDVNSPLHVLHRCDNRLCVNPDHLFLGTNADNMRDRNEKGRTCKGADRPQSKLTEEVVKRLRGLCGTSVTKASLAREYGVTRSTIRQAMNGETWKHI